MYRVACALHVLIFLATIAATCPAQEIEPRAYSRAPVGTNFILISYAHQTGDVLTDSSLPLRDVSVKLHSGTVAYGYTFGLAKKQANIGVVLPYVYGKVRGTVFENALEVKRSGLADMRVRFSMNLVGSPALTPKEFAARKPATVIGASILIVAPTGQYDPARLVNVGTNRWSFKPEVGVSKPIGRWTLEAAGGVWLFTANDNFFGGVRREQRPLASLQGHVTYTLRPRMWLAGGATYYRGGRTVINGVESNDSQSNSRLGATFSYPIGTRQSIKASWGKGLIARYGGKLNTVAIGWQYTWF